MKLLPGIAAFILFVTAVGALAQSSGVLGDWQSKAGSIVRVEPCGAQICLRLVQVINTDGATTDSRNPDPTLRNRPLCGLQIGSGFMPTDPDHARDGTLYDPKSGKTYRGNITADGATLHLRGYVGIPLFGESQDWMRPDEPIEACATATQ